MADDHGRITPRRCALGVLAFLLAGCAPGSSYTGPNFPFAASYRAGHGAAPVLLNNAEWWLRLDDPVLDRVVALALRDGLSLVLARERVTEAQAALASVPGATSLSPQITATASGTGSAGPSGAGQARLGFDWMLDPYGARRQTQNAASARVEVADAEVDAAQLLVLFNTANAYADLRYRQRLLALSRQELQGRRQTLAQTRALLDANSATRLEIARTEARVAEIQAELPGLEAAIAGRINEIAVLAGVPPGTLPIDLSTPAGQPTPDLAPDMGIPADLLRNRPDIRIRERSYYAAVADLGAARASLYPSLSLTGAITLNLLSGGRTAGEYFFGPTVQFPALPGGTQRAGVKLRESRALQAHVEWKSTVLTAILEVENALLDYHAVTSSMQSSSRASRLYREARDLTRSLFGNGGATLGDLIDAEEDLARADRAMADSAYRRALSFIALNVRLGSGNSGASDTRRSVN